MGGMGCRRPLDSNILAEDFVRNVLKKVRDYRRPVRKIVDAELALEKLEGHPTNTHKEYRDLRYRSNDERELLRARILKELTFEERLSDDDEIELGRGGARPSEARSERIAYIVSGSPASGKSKIAVDLANEYGAYILDSDYAKRKFPEYHQYPGGASLVHKESYDIVFENKKSLFEYCIYSGYNMVIPLVGKSYRSVDGICKQLIQCGYTVHIVNVALDGYKCVARAYKRFEKTNRYVPLSYVFDEVGNDPELVYFQIKRAYKDNESIGSFTQISTDVELGASLEILEASQNSPAYIWEKGRKTDETTC